MREREEHYGEAADEVAREERQSRRRALSPRSRTENPRRTSVATRRLRVLDDRDLAAIVEAESTRPISRGECVDGPRPCPYVDCRYHLMIDVTSRGSLTVNFPGLDVDEVPETCALDVADRGGATLDDVGDYLNMTRERVRQIEVAALRRYRAIGGRTIAGVAEDFDLDATRGGRRDLDARR